MLTDFLLALRTLRLPYSLALIGGTLALVVVLFFLLALGAYLLVTGAELLRWPWLEQLSGVLGGAGVLVLGWFLLPACVSALMGLFLEPLADRIERQDYPHAPEPRSIGWAEQGLVALRALGRALGYNLLALPFYFIPVLNIGAYFLVNSRLLGREYFFTVALRHLSASQAESLYRQTKRRVWLRGGVIAALFVVPGVNLLAPILATSLLTHLLWRGDSPLLSRPADGVLALSPSNVLRES